MKEEDRLVGAQPLGEDRWLSVDELAAYLGVKPDTVYTWIGKKGLPAHKMGRLWKMKRSEVDAWVRSGRAAAKLRSAKTGKAAQSDEG